MAERGRDLINERKLDWTYIYVNKEEPEGNNVRLMVVVVPFESNGAQVRRVFPWINVPDNSAIYITSLVQQASNNYELKY
jgi:hypothetical protein